LSGDVKALDLFAVCNCHIGCLSGFQDQHAIVRELRDNEHRHDCHDDPQGLVLLEVSRLEQGADDVGIAEDHTKAGSIHTHTHTYTHRPSAERAAPLQPPERRMWCCREQNFTTVPLLAIVGTHT